MTKEKETYRVKPFKEESNRYWVNYLVFGFENGSVFFICGGQEDLEAKKHLEKYLRTKKLL